MEFIENKPYIEFGDVRILLEKVFHALKKLFPKIVLVVNQFIATGVVVPMTRLDGV